MNAAVAAVLKSCVIWGTRGKSGLLNATVKVGTTNAAVYSSNFNVSVISTQYSSLFSSDFIVVPLDSSAMTTSELDNITLYIRSGGAGIFYANGWVWDSYSGKPWEQLPANMMLNRLGITFEKSDYTTSNVVPAFADVNAYADLDFVRQQGPACMNQSLCTYKLNRAAGTIKTLTQMINIADSPAYNMLLPAYSSTCASAVDAITLPINPVVPSVLSCMKFSHVVKDLLPFDITHPLIRAGLFFPGGVSGTTVSTRSTIVNATRTRWYSLGWYAVPGAILTVTVPSSVLAKIELRIGCHADTLWHLSPEIRRWPEITTTTVINTSPLMVKSYFGGLLYVNVNENNNLGLFNISIAGATALAPFYKYGTTTDSDWNGFIKNYPAPYGEIESDEMVVSLERYWLQKVTNPTLVARHLTDIVRQEDLLANTVETYKQRFVLDVHISAGYMHSGYPMMGYNDTEGSMSLTADKIPIRDGGDVNLVNQWGLFHELGHNHQNGAWTFEGSGEVTCNLFSLILSERYPSGSNHYGDRNFNPASRLEMEPQYKATLNFDNWKGDAFLALLTYVDMIYGFGWEPFFTLFAKYRALPNADLPQNDNEKRDQWMVRFSREVNRNLGPFFQSWGIPTSDAARASISSLPAWNIDTIIDCNAISMPTSPCMSISYYMASSNIVSVHVNMTNWAPYRIDTGDMIVLNLTTTTNKFVAQRVSILAPSNAYNSSGYVTIFGASAILTLPAAKYIPNNVKVSFSFEANVTGVVSITAASCKTLNRNLELIHILERRSEMSPIMCSQFGYVSCKNQRVCNWCNTTAVCTTTEATCPVQRICASYITHTCGLEKTCQWCSSSLSCKNKSDICPTPGLCLSTMNNCTADATCHWCDSSVACSQKNVTCPVQDACLYNSTLICSSHATCQWCTAQQICVFKNNTCTSQSPCASFASAQCKTDTTCQWCPTSVVCMNKTSNCPTQGSCFNASLAVCNIDPTCQWCQNSMTCNNKHISCTPQSHCKFDSESQCDSNNTCKWCAASQSCTARVGSCASQSACFFTTIANCANETSCKWCNASAGCAMKTYNCPLQSNCSAVNTLVSCASESTCQWCANHMCIPKMQICESGPAPCSGRGTLISNACQCVSEYSGANCEFPVCFNVTSNNSNACSSHGTCTAPNTCSCANGYLGPKCAVTTCFGVTSNVSSVCSGNGNCTSVDTCTCKPGISGSSCSSYMCNGKSSTDYSVCSGAGNCTGSNICTCANGFGGNNCQYVTCFGILSNSTNVCSGRGVCQARDSCLCSMSSFGSRCEQVASCAISSVMLPENVTIVRSTTALLIPTVIKSPLCSLSGANNTLLYNWTQNFGPKIAFSSDILTKPMLAIEKFAYPLPDQLYQFSLQVILGSSSFVTAVSVFVTGQTPFARIDKGDRIISTNMGLSLDGRLSTNPDAASTEQKGLSYSWSCSITGISCGFSLPSTESILFAANSLSTGIYTFTLRVSNTKRTSNPSTVKIEVTEVPKLEVSIVNYLPVVNSATEVSMEAFLPKYSNSFSFSWSSDMEAGFALLVLNSTTTKSLATSRHLIIKSNMLTPGATYKFSVVVTDSATAINGKASVVIDVSTPPAGGVLLVTPNNGTELNTQFTMQSLQWNSPIRSYRFSYILNAVEYPLSTLIPQNSFTCRLPAGNLTIVSYVVNEFNVVAKVMAELLVSTMTTSTQNILSIALGAKEQSSQNSAEAVNLIFLAVSMSLRTSNSSTCSCSGHGICALGTVCTCDIGFSGRDCSIVQSNTSSSEITLTDLALDTLNSKASSSAEVVLKANVLTAVFQMNEVSATTASKAADVISKLSDGLSESSDTESKQDILNSARSIVQTMDFAVRASQHPTIVSLESQRNTNNKLVSSINAILNVLSKGMIPSPEPTIIKTASFNMLLRAVDASIPNVVSISGSTRSIAVSITVSSSVFAAAAAQGFPTVVVKQVTHGLALYLPPSNASEASFTVSLRLNNDNNINVVVRQEGMLNITLPITTNVLDIERNTSKSGYRLKCFSWNNATWENTTCTILDASISSSSATCTCSSFTDVAIFKIFEAAPSSSAIPVTPTNPIPVPISEVGSPVVAIILGILIPLIAIAAVVALVVLIVIIWKKKRTESKHNEIQYPPTILSAVVASDMNDATLQYELDIMPSSAPPNDFKKEAKAYQTIQSDEPSAPVIYNPPSETLPSVDAAEGNIEDIQLPQYFQELDASTIIDVDTFDQLNVDTTENIIPSDIQLETHTTESPNQEPVNCNLDTQDIILTQSNFEPNSASSLIASQPTFGIE